MKAEIRDSDKPEILSSFLNPVEEPLCRFRRRSFCVGWGDDDQQVVIGGSSLGQPLLGLAVDHVDDLALQSDSFGFWGKLTRKLFGRSSRSCEQNRQSFDGFRFGGRCWNCEVKVIFSIYFEISTTKLKYWFILWFSTVLLNWKNKLKENLHNFNTYNTYII